MFTIQNLAQTEYQDVYRVTDGVLLVINKFTFVEYENEKYFSVHNAKQGKYHKGCQDWLKVLKTQYKDEYSNIIVPKGTVIYSGRPVVPTKNKAEYKYQIKTTGEAFSGNNAQMVDMLKEIINLIE